MREFFSTCIPCQANCRYCFAKWKGIYNQFPQIDEQQTISGSTTLYPCCDGEFFAQRENIKIMRCLAEKADNVCFSVSTKLDIPDSDLQQIANFHHELVEHKKGFVKLAISISNCSMISEIEPGTISYQDRLVLADRIVRAGIPFALTIKPVLPFIPVEEYCRIIQDFSKYTKYFLIGGLYVNKSTSFYQTYITPVASKIPIQKRTVDWIPCHPQWDYIEDPEQFHRIRNFCKQIEVDLFDSDEDLVANYQLQR